jgi:predicted esterase
VTLSCAFALACSGHTEGNHAQGGASASSGAPGGAGKSSANSGVGAGSTASGGAHDVEAPSSGAPPSAGDSSTGRSGGSGDGGGGSGILPDPDDVLTVKPSPGCGKDATQAKGELVKYTLQTSGTKDPNCADKLQDNQPVCGEWSVPRDYYVWLPPDYDKTNAYPLVLEGPGCGGDGTNVYSLSPLNAVTGPSVGVNGTVIRVGLTPPPASIGHGTNPGEGCFDDKEGEDSVDLVFYETLIDKLKNELCYDENRVFASGSSSGAWLANELGCKYAGNTEGYAIRGVLANGGGLPTQPQYLPTCSKLPQAGLWLWETGDPSGPFISNKFAVARAMSVNGCAGTDYDAAKASGMLENFPIGNGKPDATCQRILGCMPQHPLVVCELPGSSHVSHDDVVNSAFATFLLTLEAR